MIWLYLRRVLAQPAHAPGVVGVDLVIAADDRVPHAVFSVAVALNSGRAGMLMVSPSSIDEPLEAEEEVHLVLDDRAADGAAQR